MDVAETNYLTRFKNAQGVLINWESVLGNDLFKFVSSHTENLGCSKELLVWPLLSATSSCMGPQTTVLVNSNWTEKVVLWCVVAARRGEKKTTVISKVKQENVALEQEILALHSKSNDNSTPRLVIDERNLPEVSKYLENAKVKQEIPSLMFFIDDLGAVIRNTGDPRTVWDFMAIKRSYNGQVSNENSVRLTHDEKMNSDPFVNFIATVQALDLPALLDKDDPDGLIDRALLICARDIKTGEILSGTSSSNNSPSIQTVLSSIRNLHQVQTVTYTFSPDGESQLGRCFEAFQKMKSAFSHNESCHGAINFAFGHLVRLCGVLSALKNGLAMANRGSFLPARVIDQDTVKNVYGLVRCLLLQKFALMSSVINPSEDDALSQGYVENESSVDARMGKVSTSCASESVEDEVIEITMNGDEVERIHPKQNMDVSDSPSSSLQTVDVQSNMRQGFDQLDRSSDVMILRDGYTESYVSPPNIEIPSQPVFPNQMGDDKTFIPDTELTCGGSVTTNNSVVLNSPSDTVGPSTSFERIERGNQALSSPATPETRSSHSRRGPRPQHMFVNRSEPKSNRFSLKHHVNKFNFKSAKKMERGSTHMHHTNNLYKISDSDFLFQCGPKIRKLLLTTGNIVTASYACQYRLFPPIPVEQRMSSPRTTHPAWAAAKFFEKLQSFGFGTLLVFRGQSVKFEKKRYENMSSTAQENMHKIRLSEEDYMSSFPSNALGEFEVPPVNYEYQFHNVDFKKEDISQ